MKFSTFKLKSKVVESRLNSISSHVNTLVEISELEDSQLGRVSILQTELNQEKENYSKYSDSFFNSFSPNEAEEAEFLQIDSKISDLIREIQTNLHPLLKHVKNENSNNESITSTSSNEQTKHVRLPKLELKTFDGEVSQWVSFINLFDTAIHHNDGISNVTKFQYLVSVLSHEPLNLIKGLNISSENYVVAYNLLRDRYHNTRRLSTVHLNAVLDLPNLSVGNTRALRNFINLFNEHTQSLSALKCDITSLPNPFLSAHLLRKLDQELRRKLETFRSQQQDTEPHTLPSVDSIVKFLVQECEVTEDASLHLPQSSKTNFNVNTPLKHQKHARFPEVTKGHGSSRPVACVSTSGPSFGSSHHTPHPPLCFACQQAGHKIYSCSLFLSKSPQERSKLVKTHNRCYSCLGSHLIDKCGSKNSCQTCQKRHHTLLHFDRKTTSDVAQQPPHSQNLPQQVNSVVTSAQHSSTPPHPSHSTVLLGTTLVKLTSTNGTVHVFRALLDSGSQLDFISERAAQLLGAPRVKSTLSIIGISATTSRTRGQVQLSLNSLSDELIASQHPFHILDKISANLPRTPLSPEVFKLTQPYVLADPTFHLPGGIDVLLGGALFPLLLTNCCYSLGDNMPRMVGTKFGFVVMGSAPCDISYQPSSYFTSLLSTTDHDLHSSLQRFWTQEEPPISSRKSKEEEMCDQHFAQTHSRAENGRYCVELPFKPDHPPLGQSYETAEKRFFSLEKKFQTQPQFKKLYVASMKEHELSGHMTKVDSLDLNLPHNFLPHHGILKGTDTSAKLRVVYDASCKTSSGLSLNDILMTGPKLQVNISDVLLQFRTHKIVFTCDIRQMYLQIMVKPPHHMFQLILWRESPSDPLTVYSLNRVTFGVSSSPYLAIRTLHQLAEDEGQDYPEAATVLKTQTYVDDIICGADSVEEARHLQVQLIQLLQRGGFELRKWTSNCPELLQFLPEQHRETPVFMENTNEPHFSILGLHWSPESDAFTYNVNLISSPPTKRHVLSTIAKIYDPCGYLAPCIMTAKCFMQLLWAQGLQWDEPLTPDLKTKWEDFVSSLSSLSSISIPRAFQLSSCSTVELHGFSDASEMGYAAVLYFRCQQQNGDVVVRQILAKTRVAPLKRVTLPRLELCAAHLLAQLVAYCCDIFINIISPQNCYLWCDSSVTLTWLQTPSYRLKTYVANRVAQAQELVSPSCWRYIPTKENPADCASRGILAPELVDHPLWWTGPRWLSMPPTQWPQISFTPVDVQSTEEAKITPLSVLTTTQPAHWDFLTRYSSWTRLQRLTAYLLRFSHNLRHPEKRVGALTTSDLHEATLRLCSLIQAFSFSEEILLLQKKTSCSTRLQRLAPFLDKDGLIRVGGRLQKSSLSFEATHPILLPKAHPVVILLVDHYHQVNLHAGPQLTQALLTQRYWILSARQVIRSQIFKCVTCFKNKPRNSTPLMGDLPSPRVTPSKPFSSTGCDYCGPFQAKIHNLRAVRIIKVYLCIFICLATKAVHLEIVTDLTTDAYIAALVRFTSRRGLPLHLYSDCGTNFVGAKAVLRKLLPPTKDSNEAKKEILLFSSQRGITFHFNAPAAPHMGGLWESAVKSAKHHLQRVVGNTALSLEQLMTLATQIEALLNSRPLTPLSSDPSDTSALTPGHFLIGGPLAAVPEPEINEIPSNRLKYWQITQALHQSIWKRWSLEYLHMLQQRSKWNRSQPNLQTGDLVLVHMNTPPLTWPLARITAVHPGSDGVVRVVDLKTQNGHLTRPAVKVFPLPLN